MLRLFALLFLIGVAVQGQIAVDHVGDYEDHLAGYRFQYHDEINLLMVINALDCFVAEVVRHTPLADKLENTATRTATEAKIIQLIQGNHYTATTLGDVLETYHDTLLRALCFRSEMYRLDLSSLA